jgi:hypothetical protein
MNNINNDKQLELELDLLNYDATTDQINLVFDRNLAIYNKIMNLYPNHRINISKLKKVTYNSNPVVKFSMLKQYKFEKGFTTEQIKKIGNKIRLTLLEFGFSGYISNMLKFSTERATYVKSSQMTPLTDEVVIFNITEYDETVDVSKIYVDEAIFFITNDKYSKYDKKPRIKDRVPKPPHKGGNSFNKYNDCLFYCLNKVLNDKNPFTAESLKSYLKLNRYQKIDINLMSKIELKLHKTSISVTGDYNYVSKLENKLCIHLLLINGHYTINHDKTKKSIPFSYKNRIPIIIDNDKNSFDGKNHKLLNYFEFRDIKNYRTDYIYIPRSNSEISIEQEYNLMIIDFDLMLRESNGIINFYQTGTIKSTALYLFDKFTKTIETPEHIGEMEALYINKASKSALIFHDKYEGPAYKYDIKSMYPAILESKNKLLIPVKAGEFCKLDPVEFDKLPYYKYGIYRAKVHPSEDSHINKMFRFCNDNYYTHISLSQAKMLKLKIELLDIDNNSLLYSRDKCLISYDIFHDYMNFLFKLKERDISKTPKKLLNILWGLLSTAQTEKIVNNKDDIELNNCEMTLMTITESRYNNKDHIMEIIRNDIWFKSNFARLKPFLLAKGREIMSKIVLGNENKVVRLHTDGLLCTEKLFKHITKSEGKLGDFIFEGYCSNVKIINNCKNHEKFIV